MQNTTVTVFNGTEPLNVSLPFDSIAKLDSAVYVSNFLDKKAY